MKQEEQLSSQTKINSHFIANFNKGRNIVHNLKALTLLYRSFQSASDNEKLILCKPIIVFIGAVAEAVIFDLHYRIHSFTREGVRSLPRKAIDAIRATSTKKDEFYWLIRKCQDNEVFGQPDHHLYKDLNELRLLRNRIHIQNKEDNLEEYEIDAFTLERKLRAERTLEHVLRIMTEKYGRGDSLRYVDDFELPWPTHFDHGIPAF
jgi:hypothetical protein